MAGERDQPPNQGNDLGPQDERPTSPLSPVKEKDEKYLVVPNAGSRGDSPSSDGADTLRTDRPEDDDPLAPDPGNEHEFQVENNVFAFPPGQLGKLLNPKSLAVLNALGGLDGLEKGLRTDRVAGLSLDETHFTDKVSFEEATGYAERVRNGDAERPPPVGRVSTAATASAKPHSNSFADRIRVFKDNRLPEKKSKGLLELMWIALMDKVLLLLSGAAAISLALGLYQTFGVEHKPGEPSVEWVEGVAIMVAIAIVVIVGAGNDYQKERQFVKLNRKKEDRTVKVIRSGKSIEISVYDLLVGDVIHMEPGDLLPADGIFISGHNVKCDESSATGESDQMKKISAVEAINQYRAGAAGAEKLDPFIISGGKVLEGIGTYMVTSVGVHSSYGKIMMAFREESSATPLQMKLNDLAEAIAKLGGASALLLFIVLLIRFLVQLRGNQDPASEKAQNFMRILITAITVVVVAVPEGLPLAVTLALAFATTRMLKDNNLVRVLQACETMGNATTVCSDKTGTLTQNAMTVVAGTVGTSNHFGNKSSVSKDDPQEKAIEDVADSASSVTQFLKNISPETKDLLLQSIAQNSTAFEGEEKGEVVFIGSKTETALLGFAKTYLGMTSVSEERANGNVVQLIPFDSGRKCMGVVCKLADGQYRMYIKGASEILLERCTRILYPTSSPLSVEKLTQDAILGVKETIESYAERSLRTIGLLYRDFPSWPPPGTRTLQDDPTMAEFDDVFDDMIWIGLVGIQDPLRPGVPEAVTQCQKAGVFVRMVTGDNLTTAKAIAAECGIYTPGGLCMEGPQFRKLSEQQMYEVIPKLQVLARSSPEDKRILVRRLKEMGETVAVTGDGTNDGPALKMADVGFSMGIAGTEVAKEASSIILMDDNFSSIVKALMWGRAVNDAVKKFLQFQLTVNITAVILTFVTAVASTDETAVLSAVQLLWVNLIMDTFAALALATDPPAPSVLDRKPDPKSAPLITVNMWKMILGQAVYQLTVTFILHFAGKNILGYHVDPVGYDIATEVGKELYNDAVEHKAKELKALVFNVFVWMQIFNQYNNRRLDNKFNIFEGISRNWFFIGINFVMVGGQVMIIFVGGTAFSVVELDGVQWGISILLGAISLIIAVIIRLIPDRIFATILPKWMKRGESPQDPLYLSGGSRFHGNDQRFEWNRGIEEIREELTFLKMVRGGRLNQLKFSRHQIKDNIQHLFRSGSRSNMTPSPGDHPPPSPGGSITHKRRRSRSNSAFAAAAMVPSIVAGSIGGWSPVERPPTSSELAPSAGSKTEVESQEGGNPAAQEPPRGPTPEQLTLAPPTER